MKMLNNNSILNEDIYDVLYELGNVGVGMASVKIGQLMGMRVCISAPKVFVVEDDFCTRVESEKAEENICLVMDFDETLSGKVVFLMDSSFAREVVCKMTGTYYEGNALLEDAESLSAVEEFSNIMAGAYMKAISGYTGVRIYLKPSMVGLESPKVMMEKILDSLQNACTKAVCVDTGFFLLKTEGISEENVGRIIMLPVEESVETLVNSFDL